MTTTKKLQPPIHCVYGDFIDAIHPDYRLSLQNLIQRSKRGTFPACVRLSGKRSPALFVRTEIMAWGEKTFSQFYPETVDDLRKALGLETPAKKPSSERRKKVAP